MSDNFKNLKFSKREIVIAVVALCLGSAIIFFTKNDDRYAWHPKHVLILDKTAGCYFVSRDKGIICPEWQK